MAEQRLTVADLREAMETLEDDALVVIDTGTDLAWASEVFEQASDAIPEPFGTDPVTESTVGRLYLQAGGCGHAD